MGRERHGEPSDQDAGLSLGEEAKKEERSSGRCSWVVLVAKNPPDSAGYVRNASSIPGSERSPGGDGMESRSSILAWRIQRTEEPGGLQSVGSQIVGHN